MLFSSLFILLWIFVIPLTQSVAMFWQISIMLLLNTLISPLTNYSILYCGQDIELQKMTLEFSSVSLQTELQPSCRLQLEWMYIFITASNPSLIQTYVIDRMNPQKVTPIHLAMYLVMMLYVDVTCPLVNTIVVIVALCILVVCMEAANVSQIGKLQLNCKTIANKLHDEMSPYLITIKMSP